MANLTLASKLADILAAKIAIGSAINAVAVDHLKTDATAPAPVGDKIGDYAGAIAALGTALNESIDEKLGWLDDSAKAYDSYYTGNSNVNALMPESLKVGTDYLKLSLSIGSMVEALKTADTKDSSLKNTLDLIAMAHNKLVDEGIEEIPSEKEGEFATLDAYKASLKLGTPAADATAEDAADIYAGWPVKMISAGAVEASEMSVIASVVEAVNTEKYGVTAGRKLPTAPADFIQVSVKIGNALDDILAKGVSNNNQALKTAVAGDKDAANADVIATTDAEAVYIDKVAAALDSWQDEGADFKTKVNAGIEAVNAQVISGDAEGVKIADTDVPNTYGATAQAAYELYATELAKCHKQVNQILWGTDAEA